MHLLVKQQQFMAVDHPSLYHRHLKDLDINKEKAQGLVENKQLVDTNHISGNMLSNDPNK